MYRKYKNLTIAVWNTYFSIIPYLYFRKYPPNLYNRGWYIVLYWLGKEINIGRIIPKI